MTSCGCGSSFNTNPCTCNQNCGQYNCRDLCSAIYVQNSFNIPACNQTAVIDIPKLKTIIVGGNLWNPSYGYFEVISWNALTGQATIQNNCVDGNADSGTLIPACTQFAIVDDPISALARDWISPENSPYIYNTSTSIIAPTDATLIYQKGDRLRLKQGGGYKYFYIIGVAGTVISITGGSDYTLTNTTITDFQYSRITRPFGFPIIFNYIPIFTGFSATPTGVFTFTLDGGVCTTFVTESVAGTSNATGFTMTAPIIANTIPSNTAGTLWWNAYDNGVVLVTPGRVYISSGTIIFVIDKNLDNGTWTAANGKLAQFTLSYDI